MARCRSPQPVAQSDARMTFHPEVMPVEQRRMLRQLGSIAADRGLYLAGGTALAIQIGHRRSVDLDWFSTAAVDPMELAASLKQSGVPFDIGDLQEGTLHGTAQGVKLSFIEYRYPALVPPVEWPEYQVRLAGLEDLACMKLSAIGGRGGKKDFIDIFALGREHFTLEQMLSLYERKYDVSDLTHVLYALTYFDDAEEEEAPEMLWSGEWDDVKLTIEGWVREYVRKQAPPRAGGEGIHP